MGAGRKTETYTLDQKSQHSSSVNYSTSARNLRKSELGGVIFGCKHSTIKECYQNQLFGLPASHISYVKNIGPGLPLFLFNYSDRKLYGIFEAASAGRLNIDPHGWTDEYNSDYTPFAAQVKFKTRMQCQPLSEAQFGPVIADNYYEPRLFWNELDQGQTNKLISLFSSSPVTASVSLPISTAKKSTLLSNPSQLPISTAKKSTLLSNPSQKDGGTEGPASYLNVAKQKQANTYQGSCGKDIGMSEKGKCSEYDGRSFSSLFKNNAHSIGELKHAQTGKSPFDTHGLTVENGALDGKENKEALEQNIEVALPSVDNWESLCSGSSSNGETNASEYVNHVSKQYEEQFECLKQQMEDLYTSVSTDPCLPQSVPSKGLSTAYMGWEGGYLETRALEGNTSCSYKSETENNFLPEAGLLSNVKSPDLHSIVEKIQEEVTVLRLKQFKQEQKICSLENELVESRGEIMSLKQQLKTSKCISFKENDVIESKSSADDSILIIGGYNGLSYVPTLECYSPSHGLLETLCPMSSIRSCTSTVKLNGEVYVIGGLKDNVWYDTVESYNLVENQWATHPSLNQKKGGLAGVSLNGNIFAIGGGNGVKCFSDVELFDPDVGRWIPTRSMLSKRFTPAAAEINGVIYVVGGFDGNDYLKSVERFDPRENSWSRLVNMSTKRGCHSLAVLNENLYAIGGYDGARMVSTVEIFEPRIGSWRMGESLNNSKGYFASVVIGSLIFIIGGVNEKDEVLDTVERYKEGHGWQSTQVKALGKRCYLSAVPISG